MKKRRIMAWIYIAVSLVLFLGLAGAQLIRDNREAHFWIRSNASRLETYVDVDFNLGTKFIVAAMCLTLFIIGVKELNLIVREQSHNEIE